MSLSDGQIAYAGMQRRISKETWRRVAELPYEIRTVEPRKTIVSKSEKIGESLLLMEGWIGRYITHPVEPRGQMVALQIPGDFLDLHGFPTGVLDHDVQAITRSRIAVFSHEVLAGLIEAHPEVAIELWRLTMIDAAIHRHWSFRLGAMRSITRVANFLYEMKVRLELSGRSDPGGFELPLTQTDMSVACGMTPVHLNRVLRDLREDGCCILRGGAVEILDDDRLKHVSRFDPAFLYLEPRP